MSSAVPESTLTADQLLKLAHFRRELADALDTSLAAGSIADGEVTLAKMADLAASRIIGRITSTGVPQALTGAQATTILDAFTSALKGLAPASGGGTANYLRADGTWAAPPGSVAGDTPYVDLSLSPYSVVAESTAAGAANAVAINAAIVTYSGTGAWLIVPSGNVYVDWITSAGADYSIKFGTGISDLTLCGAGMYGTTLIQHGTGTPGEWDAIVIDGASRIEICNLQVKQGTIKIPDNGEQNHLIAVYNNTAGGVTKDIRLRGIKFGKCIGDQLRLLAGTAPDLVENVDLFDFEMNGQGVCMQDWAVTTAYALWERVVNDSGKQYVCSKAGTSAGSGGPTGTGSITFSDLTISAVDTALDTLTATTHARLTGDGPVQFTTTGGLPGGLSVSTDYWLIVTDANTLKVATSALNAHAGTAVDLTSSGSGTNLIVDTADTQRAMLDGSVAWFYDGPRTGARSGISLQRGFKNVSFVKGKLIGAQNSIIDFEPTANGFSMDGALFQNLHGDNINGSTGGAMSFSGVSLGDNLKNVRVIDVTCLNGRVNIGGSDNMLVRRLTCIIDDDVQSDPDISNVVVRQDCSDIVLEDLRIERNGGTAGVCLDIENSGSRTTIKGGLFVQGTAAIPVYMDGVPGGINIVGTPVVRYTTGSGAASYPAVLIEAQDTGNVDHVNIDGLVVQCVTGTLRAAVELQVRTPYTLGQISIRGVKCAGEAAYAVLMGVGVGGTMDTTPLITDCDSGTTAVWRQEDAGTNPLYTQFPIVAGNKTAPTCFYEGDVADPNTLLSAVQGSAYTYRNGSNTDTWRKHTGTGNTGWLMANGNIANANTIGGVEQIHIFEIADAATADYDIVLRDKTEVTDVTVIKTAGAGIAVTAQVKNGATAITDAMIIGVADQTIVRALTIDDAASVIAAAGTLRVSIIRTTSGAGCKVIVRGIRRA